MKKLIPFILLFFAFACTKNGSDSSNDDSTNNETADDTSDGTLHNAFSLFDEDNTSIYIENNEVVIETNGLPNHTSPYWSTSNELYVEPTVTSIQEMAPGNIDNFNGSYTLRVDVDSELASSSSATGLGAIGIAVSGAVIYNDEEGPNVPLENEIGTLDYSGAHTGPQSYHYHLEPKAWSDDDDVLVGIISDGFFVYGRKCSLTGTYPTDLDASGGHTHTTDHSESDEYHYHVNNEAYLNQYYIIFPGDYQGTPNAIQ